MTHVGAGLAAGPQPDQGAGAIPFEDRLWRDLLAAPRYSGGGYGEDWDGLFPGS